MFRKPKLKYYILNKKAKAPTRATKKSACWDLYAAESKYIEYGGVAKIGTGLRLVIPKGYRVDVRPRSGMFMNFGIIVGNSPGTIDEDYPGETCVLFAKVVRGAAHFVKKGDRIAQISLEKVTNATLEETKKLPKTGDRKGGFGSTGR
jgi:dUTP pyrophosphatase